MKLLLLNHGLAHEIIPSFLDYINADAFESITIVTSDKESILDALYSYRPLHEWPSHVSIKSDFKDVSPSDTHLVFNTTHIHSNSKSLHQSIDLASKPWKTISAFIHNSDDFNFAEKVSNTKNIYKFYISRDQRTFHGDFSGIIFPPCLKKYSTIELLYENKFNSHKPPKLSIALCGQCRKGKGFQQIEKAICKSELINEVSLAYCGQIHKNLLHESGLKRLVLKGMIDIKNCSPNRTPSEYIYSVISSSSYLGDFKLYKNIGHQENGSGYLALAETFASPLISHIYAHVSFPKIPFLNASDLSKRVLPDLHALSDLSSHLNCLYAEREQRETERKSIREIF